MALLQVFNKEERYFPGTEKWDGKSLTVRLAVEFAANADKLSTLSDELKILVASAALSDFTINCNGQRFKTYKLILASRSDVFLKMFQDGFAEAESGEVVIGDFAPEVMKLFLDFLLNDHLPPEQLALHASQLYSAAHRYHVEPLRVTCMNFLANHVEEGNWFEAVSIAEQYEDERIFTAAVKVLMRDGETIMASEEWEAMDPKVINKVMARMIKGCSEPMKNFSNI